MQLDIERLHGFLLSADFLWTLVIEEFLENVAIFKTLNRVCVDTP